MGPGDLGRKKTKNGDENTKQPTKVPENTKDIWLDAEVPMGAEYDDVHDLRKQPE